MLYQETAREACRDLNEMSRRPSKYGGSRPEDVTVKPWRRIHDSCLKSLEARQTVHKTMLGCLAYGTTSTPVDDDDQYTTKGDLMAHFRVSFVPSTALAWIGISNAISLRVARLSQVGWKLTLESPRVVPDDAPLFEACRSGDTTSVRELLADGKASVWDVDSTQGTPLHWAAEGHHAELCEVLLDAGADVHARDLSVHSYSPLTRACHAFESGARYIEHVSAEPRQIQTFRKLIAGGFNFDESEGECRVLRFAMWGDQIALMRRSGCKAGFEYPSQWLLGQLLPDALALPELYGDHFWADRLREAMPERPGENPSSGVLPYCSESAAQICLIRWCRFL